MADWDSWQETIEEGLDEAGITATEAQIEIVCRYVHGKTEMDAMSRNVAASNYRSNRDDEIKRLQDALWEEQQKVTCSTCNGSGLLASISCDLTCHRCNGEGRHGLHP